MNADGSKTDNPIDWPARQRQTLRALQRRLVRHLKAGRSTDLAEAPMPNAAGVYTDPARYEAERQKLFLELPLVAGLSGDIPKPGDTLVFDAGRPIIVVRNGQGQAKAFLNICRHRGARLVEESGCHARFTCPFHSWSFDLDGRLAGQPGKVAFEGLDAAALGLVQVPCTESHGLIFVKAQPGSGPIDVAAHLGSFAPELAEIGLQSFAPVKSGTMKANGNWKYVLETFGESYHLASLHPDTLANTIYGNVLLFDRFAPHHRIAFAPRSYGELLDKPESEWPELYNVLYMIFPNTAEDVLEALHHRGGAGAGRAGHRHDRMFPGHGWPAVGLGLSHFLPVQRALVEQRRDVGAVHAAVVLLVVALDALDLVARAEHHRDALVDALRLHFQHAAAAGAGGAAGLHRQLRPQRGGAAASAPRPGGGHRHAAVARRHPTVSKELCT